MRATAASAAALKPELNEAAIDACFGAFWLALSVDLVSLSSSILRFLSWATFFVCSSRAFTAFITSLGTFSHFSIQLSPPMRWALMRFGQPLWISQVAYQRYHNKMADAWLSYQTLHWGLLWNTSKGREETFPICVCANTSPNLGNNQSQQYVII